MDATAASVIETAKKYRVDTSESVSKPRSIKVWLDCDPGHDDAFAIILAAHSRYSENNNNSNNSIELLGVSTIAGNQTVEKTTKNALKVLSISGRENIDVVQGQAVPLVRPSRICPEIHGNTGLDCSMEFPPLVQAPVQEKAVLHMFNVISKQKERVTLIATGCLTNVALLFTLFPEVKINIEQVVIMGGAMGIGNMTPVAEWNILIDPESAKIVFEAGVKLVMVPLEVSHTALVTPEVIARIEKLQTPFSRMMVELLLFFAETYKKTFNFEYPPLHDPLTVAYVINPSLFQTILMRVDIETSSELTSGQTVCDVYHMSNRPKNAYVAQKVDVNSFWELIYHALESANRVSKLNKTT